MPAQTMKKVARRLAATTLAAALAIAPEAGMAMGGGRGGSNDIGFAAGFQGGAQNADARGAGPRGDAHKAGDAGRRPSNEEARGPMRIHRPEGPGHAGDYFHDERLPGPPDDPLVLEAPVLGGVMDRGRTAYDPAHADHRLIGPVFDEVRRDWPADFLFGPQMYGARDFPHCMRRDVYGDPYQAC
jgi:hypothetical protein